MKSCLGPLQKGFVLQSEISTPGKYLCKDGGVNMFSRKIHVKVVEPGEERPCPVGWLDSFCMRSFTGRSAFDDVLPVADGWMETGFRVDLQFLRNDLEDWFTRKFGGGSQVKLQLTEKGNEAGLERAG